MTTEMFGDVFGPWIDSIPFDNSNPSTRLILNIKRETTSCKFMGRNFFVAETWHYDHTGRNTSVVSIELAPMWPDSTFEKLYRYH